MRPYGQEKRGKMAAWYDGLQRERVNKVHARRDGRREVEAETPWDVAIPQSHWLLVDGARPGGP